MDPLAALLAARAGQLPFYSAYRGLMGLDQRLVYEQLVLEKLRQFGRESGQQRFATGAGASECLFFYTDLAWDSTFFGFRTVRLQQVLFAERSYLVTALPAFIRYLRALDVAYCFMEVPGEDPAVLQALGRAGWALVETRLQYVHDLGCLSEPRYPVRAATAADRETLRRVAAGNPNPFDRFHADPQFTPEQANAFLGAYAAAAVDGYCDTVLLPAEPGLPTDSFLAISHLRTDAAVLGVKLRRAVLTAVGESNRGWHRKLVSETLYQAREQDAKAVLMTTQATNRAVVHNCEVLGFRLTGMTHVLSWRRD